MNTATFIKQCEGFRGVASLYRLDPPLEARDWRNNLEGTYEYVIVSAADDKFSGPETYLFPADETGEIVNWDELDGSYKGGFDHARALAGAGYLIRNEDTEVAR